MEEATWEREDIVHANYHFLFKDENMFFSHWILNDCCICMCLYVLVCVDFEDKIILRGGERKTRKKLNFSENGQNSKLPL